MAGSLTYERPRRINSVRLIVEAEAYTGKNGGMSFSLVASLTNLLSLHSVELPLALDIIVRKIAERLDFDSGVKVGLVNLRSEIRSQLRRQTSDEDPQSSLKSLKILVEVSGISFAASEFLARLPLTMVKAVQVGTPLQIALDASKVEWGRGSAVTDMGTLAGAAEAGVEYLQGLLGVEVIGAVIKVTA